MTRRRTRCGATFVELITAASILVASSVLLVQSAVSSAQHWQETQRRRLAMDLADAALEHACLVDWDQWEQAKREIEQQLSEGQDGLRVDLQLGEIQQDLARRVSAVVTWQDAVGMENRVSLDMWRDVGSGASSLSPSSVPKENDA